MRLRAWLCLALSSISIASVSSAARPRYGGTLTLDLSGTFNSPEASDLPPILSPLVAETLTRINGRGELEPRLASAWQPEAETKRWRISLRANVFFQDGQPLNAGNVAPGLLDELKKQFENITVLAGGQTLVIQADHALPDLPLQLANPRFAITRKSENNLVIGTGPFRLSGWEPRRRLTLTAFDDYWGGRPYLDSIVVNLASSVSSNADLFDIPFASPRRIVPEGPRIWVSHPRELLALVAASDIQPVILQALAASIDRAPIVNVLAQRQGQAAFGLLPQWLTGYEFLFQTMPDLARARQLAAQIKLTPVTLGYPPGDSFARAVAERVALNAHDAGIAIQPTANQNANLHLVRWPIESADAAAELARIAALLGAADRVNGLEANKPETLYEAERGLLESNRVIPVVHLPLVLGTAHRVHFDGSATADQLTPNLAGCWVDR
ncbi:MAG TPA: ABC transporter substrate-binding protein [Bryobacteraceae bacterium]|nr:ABC transporter substrate-binding protein [Bryobacteraceae bacterium]